MNPSILESPRLRTQDWDTPWKQALHLFFQDFLEYCFPPMAARIDWTKPPSFLDKELKKASRAFAAGNQIADTLIRVWMQPEEGQSESEEVWILFHLELQSTQSADFAKRMCRYYVRIWELYDRPIVSIAILSDRNPNWRPHQYESMHFNCRHMLQYLVVKILDYQDRRAELEASHNLFAPVILSQLMAIETEEGSQERLEQRIALSQRLYARGFTEVQIGHMLNLFDFMLPLKPQLMVKYDKAIEQIEEEYHMTYTDRIEERGREAGLQAGRQAGLQAGRQAGLDLGRQERVILFNQLLEVRFGTLEAYYLKQISQADSELLSRWVKRLATAETLEQIFAETSETS